MYGREEISGTILRGAFIIFSSECVECILLVWAARGIFGVVESNCLQQIGHENLTKANLARADDKYLWISVTFTLNAN